jgi:ATP/ADP translocase/HEAT repeat protein
MVPGVAHIRPEERRGATAAFLTIFGILAAHTLLETARDALFLARLPATQLPWVYLVIAVVAVLVYELPLRGRRRRGVAWRLPLLLAGFAVVTFGFWALASWQSRLALFALYVWTGIVASLSVIEFWIVLSERYTVGEAKRIYGVVGTGSLLGAVAGAAVARAVAQGPGAPYLVLASAGILFLTAIGPALLLGTGTEEPAPARSAPPLGEAMKLLRGHPYLRGLAGFLLVSTVALTLADYVFKSAVSREIPAEDLASFFAGFYMAMNVLALAAQVLLTGWLFRTLGVHRTLWLLPGLLFLGAAGVALGGGLAAAFLLKGADGTLRNSLHRTGSELLFVPLADSLRNRTKGLIDLVGQRGGQAVASLLILAEITQHRGDAVLAAAAAALCLVWAVWVADLRTHYLDLFRTALREGSISTSLDLPPLDLGSLEALFVALNSADDGEVLAAVDLLAEEGRTRLIPALILYHPSPAVVLRALDLFARSGRTDFLPIADRLLGHARPEVRAAALRARTAIQNDEAILRPASQDPSPLVRATALVGLVSGGWVSDEAGQALDDLMASASPEARLALARAIRETPAAAFEEVLLRLAETADQSVQSEAALAMGEMRVERFLPALLPLLADRDTRGAARSALLAFGSPALAFLDEALGDEALPHELRRHLPRTISLFEPPAAATVLLRHFERERDGMVRYKILRGLNRLASHPGVTFDHDVLRRAAEATLAAAFRLVDWRLTLDRGAQSEPRRRTPGHELLVSMLRDKEVHALERLFRIFSLQFRGEDFKDIYRGLHNQDRKVRAGSRELLEHLIAAPLRGAVVALVDDAPDAERLARAQPFYAPQPLDYETLMGLILEESSESVRCIAAYHVAELGLTRLRGRLESFRSPEVGFFLSRVVERALSLLSPPGEQAVAHAG